ncbi:MAG: PEP-CTERM sorting domain-containing protein [Pirellulales bacterium]
MRTSIVRMVVIVVFSGSAAALAHEDVVPYGFGGKILTGGHDDVLATDNVSQQVFGYDFGEDPGDPYIIGDPGFNNGAFGIGVYPNNGLLPVNFTLGFDVVSNLQYWDGLGGVSFAAAPADVLLGLRRSSSTVLIDGAGGQSGTVPTIGSTGAAGRLHVHLESQLHFTDATDPTAPNAPEGIYLVGLQLKLPGSGLADSDPIYFVYNNGLDEEVHDEAIDWVQVNLVPEPGAWLLALSGVGGLALIARRRREVHPRGVHRRGVPRCPVRA